MDNLTSGVISEEKVQIYLRCLNDFEGNINKTLQNAYDVYSLNTGVRTEDNDSWYEALTRYKS